MTENITWIEIGNDAYLKLGKDQKITIQMKRRFLGCSLLLNHLDDNAG